MNEKKPQIHFPCRYPIKIVAYNGQDIYNQLVAELVKLCPSLQNDNISVRYSKDGKYQSITANIQAQSEEHVALIFKSLKQINQVIMIL